MTSELPAEDISKGQQYFNQRIQLYGITPELNEIRLWQSVQTDAGPENTLQSFPVFTPCEKGIEILVYSLDRLFIKFKTDGSRWSKDYKIIRLHTPFIDSKGKEHKYHIPKGAGTHPFFPPGLIKKFEDKEKIKTLVLTEGYFKAFKAGMHGLDIVGLGSITHYKDKEKGTLHTDIVRLIKECQVENVIWLADGDCNRISTKAFEREEDIAKRPNQFFQSCENIKTRLDDYDVQKFFAHIDSINIQGMPKGLDDLLIELPGKENEIIEDLLQLSKDARYFYRENMSSSTRKIHKYFRLHDKNQFVEYHSDQLQRINKILNGDKAGEVQDLKSKDFVWFGTKYHWDDEKNECVMVVPRESKLYFRVGDQYHEKIGVPNKYGEIEHTFHRRQKQTIIDDYGKKFVEHIPKYKAFCNVPDHTNYQEVIHNCFNMYHPFEHEAMEEDGCEHTMRFLKHIFGDRDISVKHKSKGEITVNELDLGLDYVQLLYQKPQQILPILCLVSKENGTGKTTLAKWLKQVFSQNVAIVGNAELANDFNASWAGKLLVICDEAKIDKQVVVERVKSLSTADKIFMNAKGKDHVEIDFFAKFIFLTNNEENFIYAGEDDVRYWIRKVPPIQDLFVGLLDEMIGEIPAFLDMLNKRKMKTEQLHRAWFFPELIKTEALKKVIEFSMSSVQKEIRHRAREAFFDHGCTELRMNTSDIMEHFLVKKVEENYLAKVLKEQMQLERYFEYEYEGEFYQSLEKAQEKFGDRFDPAKALKRQKTTRYSFPIWNSTRDMNGRTKRDRAYINGNGRPFIFPIERFLLKEEIEGRWIDPEARNDAQIHQDSGSTWPEPAHSSNGTGNQEDLPF